MASSINERLSRIEDQFLQAAIQGVPALTVFHDSWTRLLLDIEHAVEAGSIDGKTMSLRNVVAPRVATLSDYLLEFQAAVETMSSSLHSELDKIFARIDINDDRRTTSPTGPSISASDLNDLSRPDRTPLPPYIQHAYSWLLDNLHNPYPSKNVRAAIALETKSDRKSIDAWFVDARKRMGWNALRKTHFSNKRVDIVDAATRFFDQEDPKRPLDPNLPLQFVAIEARAKELYSEKFTESMLAAKLDVAVKDMTPEMKAQAKENQRRRRHEEKVKQSERSARDAIATSSYPSPDRSPHRTPEPSLPSPSSFSSEADVQALSEPRVSNKRRSLSPVQTDFGTVEPPSKRHRSEASSSAGAITPIGLPSPAPSFHESHESSSPIVSNPLPIPFISSRKRRLSDADLETYNAPKRPCNLPVWPRPHAVSDPLPLPSGLPGLPAVDDWFHNNFEIPNPVSVEGPDESTPLEIDFFDYSTIDSSALQIFDPPTDCVEQSVNHTSPAVEPLTPNQVPSYALEISSNDFNCAELFCDPEAATPELLEGDLPPTSFPIPSSTDFASNAFDPNSFSFLFPDPVIDTATIVESSTPVFQDPASNLQWPFPSVIPSQHLLGPLDELQNPGLDFFTQDNSFMFDPSMMGLYSSSFAGDSVLPLLTAADKAAKQRKLLEMREATRRLEAEIAAS